MKITIYELLGLVKDGKAPKKIKYKSVELEYEEKNEDYCYYFNRYLFEYKFTTCNGFLNDEVEIPDEEPKKIEKLELESGKIYDKEFLAKYITHNRHKINEIIDKINNLKEK